MPCPAAGMISSAVKYRAMRPSRPSRFSPAAASTRAAYCPSSSFRRRVSTLPRTGATSISGYRAASWMARRREAQPMGRDASSSVFPAGSTRASRESSRLEKAARGSRGSVSMGRSLQEWTVMSTRPSSRAASSSRTKRPLPPTLSRVRSRILSPVVFMVTSSSSMPGSKARMASITSWDCFTARTLSRLPMRSFILSPPSGSPGWQRPLWPPPYGRYWRTPRRPPAPPPGTPPERGRCTPPAGRPR